MHCFIFGIMHLYWTQTLFANCAPAWNWMKEVALNSIAKNLSIEIAALASNAINLTLVNKYFTLHSCGGDAWYMWARKCLLNMKIVLVFFSIMNQLMTCVSSVMLCVAILMCGREEKKKLIISTTNLKPLFSITSFFFQIEFSPIIFLTK